MSSSSGSTNGRSNHESYGNCCGNWGKGGNWSVFNTAAMVIGFVLFWPIGLVILFWILTGRNVRDIPESIRHQWSKMTGSGGYGKNKPSDNVVFNEFQQTQYDRIREIKEEIKERSHRFGEFRANAKRRADEKEFNRFMADAPGQSDS